jgi:hypothetical protein
MALITAGTARRSRGESSREALRSLKRQLAKVVYRRLVADQVHLLALDS